MLIVAASVHLNLYATLPSSWDGAIITKSYHNRGGKGSELVKLVTIRAHDLGCTRIDELFFQEVNVLDAGFHHVGMKKICRR